MKPAKGPPPYSRLRKEPEIIDSGPISDCAWQIRRGRSYDSRQTYWWTLLIVSLTAPWIASLFVGPLNVWVIGVLYGLPVVASYKLINHNTARTIRIHPTGLKITDGLPRKRTNAFHLISLPPQLMITATEAEGGSISLMIKNAQQEWIEVANGALSEMESLQAWIEEYYDSRSSSII